MTRAETTPAKPRDTEDGSASGKGAGYKEGAKDVAREAQVKAEQVKDKVVEQSAETRDELQDQARSTFKELRGAIADQIDRIQRVLRTTEEEMHEQQLDELARYPGRLAEGIQEVNDYLRERSAGGMRSDFERAMERAPVAVIGGLAAVGGLCAWYLRRDPAGVGDGQADFGGSRAAEGHSYTPDRDARNEGERGRTERGRTERRDRVEDEHGSA